MTDIRVRNVDNQVVAALKAQAKRHGHTFGDELRQLLAEAAHRPRREMVDKLRQLHEAMRLECGLLPDSTPGIREERDRWS